jgi:small conductance mechanosensitive channel
MSVFGADHSPATLVGSCGDRPGVACRLVWDVSQNGRAATLTNEYLAGPLNVVLRVAFIILLALACQALAHRLINRLTERATLSLLPYLRNGTTASFRVVPSPAAARRLIRGRLPRRRHSAPAGADLRKQDAVSGAAAQAESALVDERRKQRVRALGAILRSGASVTIFAIAGFVVLGDLDINLAPLLASAGVVGVAIGFGAQSLVRDYLAGIFMLVEDQYGVGDVITVGDATGTVENVTLRLTRVRDVNGIVWHIRNGGIEVVGNESQGWARAVIDFPVPFEADLATIRDLLTQAGEAMWNDPVWRAVMLEPPEVWGAQEISSEEVTMRIVAKTAPLRQWEVEREMRARVKAALHEAGIFPAPAAD